MEQYKKLTQREHVLLRPETYISTTSIISDDLFVADDIEKINSTSISKKHISYSPAFIKIFDECLVNATDHYIRSGKVKNIHIYVNRKENYIQIVNDGPSIPIDKNKDGINIPELIFFNFLSGSNFDDSSDRFTGGRNGIGIKATATFSKEFYIEINNGKKIYTQNAIENLLKISKPVIKPSSNKKEYVSVKYHPDLEKFNMSEIDEVSISLIIRRILESKIYCGKGVNMYYNDELINLKTCVDYFKVITQSDEIFHEKWSNEWDICVAKSNSDQFEHMSIVNGISTYNGGTHVNYISLTLSKLLAETFHKKYKVTWQEVKNNLFIFVVSKIANPTFNSQSKDQLTNPITKEVLKDSTFSPKIIKSITNSDIVKSIIEKIELKNKLELSKMQNQKKVKVEKLVDANIKDRSKCELFIFEGDSAGSPMRSYRYQNQGYFCLRGKFINVSELDPKKIVENKEAFGLMQAIGIKWGDKSIQNIRFSKIVIATDADVDGDSITGQLLNFFSNWPELFERKIIHRNITPLLVVGDRRSKKELFFYTQEEFNKFMSTSFKESIHDIQYKKGIGSLDPHQFKMIITNPILHQYSIDDISMNKLNVWFGKNAELRKTELVKS